MDSSPLPAAFFARDPVIVARQLLGKFLWRRSRSGITGGRIVETEAYLAEGDPACHASLGKNRKNEMMFGRAGLAYVYVIHARHCFNVVTDVAGKPSAVLIRAVEPCVGLTAMARRRGRSEELDFCRGPARLCEAFDISRKLNGWDLSLGRRLWLTSEEAVSAGETVGQLAEIGSSPRIGVTAAQDLPLRYFLRASAYVSGPRRLLGMNGRALR